MLTEIHNQYSCPQKVIAECQQMIADFRLGTLERHAAEHRLMQLAATYPECRGNIFAFYQELVDVFMAKGG